MRKWINHAKSFRVVGQHEIVVTCIKDYLLEHDHPRFIFRVRQKSVPQCQ